MICDAACPSGRPRRTPLALPEPSFTSCRGAFPSPSGTHPGTPACWDTSPASKVGSHPLDLALAPLAQMASSPRDRSTGDRHPVAPPGVPTLLAPQEPIATAGAAADRSRDPRTHPGDAPSEPQVGCTADPWRAAQAGIHAGAIDRLEAPPPRAEASLARMANVPAKPSSRCGGRGLRRRANGQVPAAVRVRGAEPRGGSSFLCMPPPTQPPSGRRSRWSRRSPGKRQRAT